MNPTDPRIEVLLIGVSDADRTRLFNLRSEGPQQWQRLFNDRPHHSKLWRLSTRGSRGVRMRVIETGDRSPKCCLLWFAMFAAEVADARGQRATGSQVSKARRSRCRASRRSSPSASPSVPQGGRP